MSFAAHVVCGSYFTTVQPKRHIRWHSVASLPYSQPSAQAKQPVHLPKKPGFSDVYVFGVEHETHMMQPADFILKHKPAAVVFENSFSAAGGNGAVVNCNNVNSHDGSPAVLLLCRLAAEMTYISPQQLEVGWQQMGAALDVEMLAHLAAFRVKASVIHADRLLADKFQRLYDMASVADLDAAVGAQVCINYSDMLGQPLQHTSLKAAALVHHIHISERDAMITESIQQAASRHSSETVVGVVGEDHLQGIAECWETSPVQFLLKTASNISASTQSSAVDAPTYLGVKQALFERFFDLSSSAATCAAMQQILPPLPEEAVEAYQLTWEVYGNSRLMLACLCKQDLAKVCSGQECDLWELLAPVRALRPVNGGIGYSEEVVIELRQLMLDLS